MKENRRVVQFDSKGNAIAVYGSPEEASAHTHIPVLQIYSCLKGAWKATHGYKFQYEVTNAELKAKKREENRKKSENLLDKWK